MRRLSVVELPRGRVGPEAQPNSYVRGLPPSPVLSVYAIRDRFRSGRRPSRACTAPTHRLPSLRSFGLVQPE